MAAPQQSSIPVYKETANIPSPRTINGLFSARDTPGYALANLLGVSSEAMQRKQKKTDEAPSQMEQEQLAALASVGAERDRLKLAGGRSMFGVMSDPDASIDSYQLNRGRREADIYAGKLRDAYAASGLAENDDPKAFQAFVDQQREAIFGDILKSADPSFQHGFLTNISSSFDDMTKAHAGNLDTFITSRNKTAMETRITQKAAIDLADTRERTAFSTFSNSIMGGESGGNYNAFHRHANNTAIRFTDMTLQEVMDWQKSGQWQRYGAGSSAVGKYQIIDKTMLTAVKIAGLDPAKTKFTPATQDKLFYALMNNPARGKFTLDNFLAGKITSEELLDNTLSYEWAALQATSGRGRYDGDGKNHAGTTAAKTIAALNLLRESYVADPKSAAIAKDSEGKAMLIGPRSEVGAALEVSEAEYGVPKEAAASAAANAYIKALEADPALAERDDLDDLMDDAKLPEGERAKVIAARDRLRSENANNAMIQQREQDEAIISSADQYIRSGSPEALADLKQRNPEIYGKLLALSANPATIEHPDEAEQQFFLATPRDSEFRIKALRAFSEGQISRATYTKAVKQYEVAENAREVLELPGVEAYVSSLEQTLPVATRGQFKDALAVIAEELREANGGNRPSITEIMAQAQALHGTLAASAQQDLAAVDAKYN